MRTHDLRPLQEPAFGRSDDVDPTRDQPSPDGAEPRTLGAALRHTRLARKLHTKEAANALHLPVAVIEAMEADDFDQLGAPIYVRSYLTRYADLLDLPRETVLARYRELGLTEPPLQVTNSVKPASSGKGLDLRWVLYPLLGVGLLWLGWLGVQQLPTLLQQNRPTAGVADNDSSSGNSTLLLPGQNGAAAAAVTAAVETVADDAGPAASAAPPDSPPSPAPAAANVTQTDTSTLLPTDSTATAETPSAEAQTETGGATSRYLDALLPQQAEEQVVAPQTDQFRLDLRFSADCWVEVSDAEGNRLLYGTLKADSSHSVSGKPPFNVTLGNSTAVQLILNGEPVAKELFWREGGVSRFTLPAGAG